MEEKEIMEKYFKCRNAVPSILENGYFCSPDSETLGEKWKNKKEIDKEQCESCPKFRSRYIEYPITVNKIEKGNPAIWDVSFVPVAVRLCKNDKTYFGIYIGEIPWRMTASLNEETGCLTIDTVSNPGIYVPALGKIVYGAESWWRRLSPDEDVSDITDDDIRNTWYMKLLSEMKGDKSGTE